MDYVYVNVHGAATPGERIVRRTIFQFGEVPWLTKDGWWTTRRVLATADVFGVERRNGMITWSTCKPVLRRVT